MGSYLSAIGGEGLAAAQQESRRKAREISDREVRKAQAAKVKRDLASAEAHAAQLEKEADEKRARLQAENDAILAEAEEKERQRSLRQWVAAGGTPEEHRKAWAEGRTARIQARIDASMKNVADPSTYSRGDFTGFGATFSPIEFPS